MRNLDHTKKYDLSQLNNEQLQAVLDWLKENDTGWRDKEIKNLKTSFCVLGYICDEWILKRSDYDTNALELFEEEKAHDIYQRADQLMQDGKQHGLKIVVKFEKL